jgi:hypothetical protein
MSPLAVLTLAIPLYGFALAPTGAITPTPAPGSLLAIPAFAQVVGEGGGAEGDAATSDAGEAEASDVDGEMEAVEPVEPAAEPASSVPGPEEAAEAAQEEPPPPSNDMQDFAAQLRQRQELASVHRAFGIATWGAMLITEVLGLIQFNNLYGFFAADAADTPCVQGTAAFGQDQCYGVPYPHLVASMTTTALYATTFTLSFLLPDPAGASEGDGAFANNLRIHKTLRWVHLVGMVAQVFLGFASAGNWFGVDRANDYDAQLAIASVHQLIGLTTFGVLTAAGALMLF